MMKSSSSRTSVLALLLTTVACVLVSAWIPGASSPALAQSAQFEHAEDERLAELAKIVADRPQLRLIELATYETGIFDDSAAEIVAYDRLSQQLYVSNSAEDTIDVLDISAQRRPRKVGSLDLEPWGSPNSVAAYDGVVAVAVESDPQTDPGQILFFDSDGNFLRALEAGALPDMLTFSPDGQRVVAANEGEPDNGIDPEGSVSIVDLSGGVDRATIAHATFTRFDGREQELRAKGVRLFPGKRVSEDVEPEYVAISPDGSRAMVTLQENNALAVVDLENAEVLDILPLGSKDHSRGPEKLRTYRLRDLPVLGTTSTTNPSDPGQTTPGQQLRLGGLSGLWFEGVDVFTGHYRFATVPDRGPNGEPTDVDNDGGVERPFPLPDYQARLVRLELDPEEGTLEVTQQLPFWRRDGSTPITGLPNIPGLDEEPVDLFGNPLPYDALGADMEGVVVAPDGSIWTVDEYRPAIYHFDSEGVLIERYVPEGTAALAGAAAGTFGLETLPAEYANRRRNRGFEAMAYDPESGWLWAFIQTPLANPDRAASDASDVIRMLAIDTADGSVVAEHVYLLEAPDLRLAKVDKIGDAVWAGPGQLYVIERDSSTERGGKKGIFHVDLRGATNLRANDAPELIDGLTLEQHTPDQLRAQGIQPVSKRKALNLPSLGYLAGDKPEGLALLPGGKLAVLNDNDFGLLDQEIPVDGTVPVNPNPTAIVLGLIHFAEGNGLDASDRDDRINIRNWPVHGLYMPDAIASFLHRDGPFYLTANEGDARDEDERVKDLVLDPESFPHAELQDDDQLGRLEVSGIDGDVDGDGDYDQLYSYGARSFTIWDQYGNRVWDSGDDLAQITALAAPGDFNATNDENGSFDSRSDAKGSEPEAITTGWFRGRRYAYIGLERVGGIVIYDISNPYQPTFAGYVNRRDFTADAEAGEAGDLGPEDILYIPRDTARGVFPTLVVANEVSGTVTLYRVRYVPQD